MSENRAWETEYTCGHSIVDRRPRGPDAECPFCADPKPFKISRALIYRDEPTPPWPVQCEPASLTPELDVGGLIAGCVERVLRKHRLNQLDDNGERTIALVDALSVGPTISTGVEEVAVLADELVGEVVAALRSRPSEDVEGLDAMVGLHDSIEIIYVVDGYEAALIGHDGATTRTTARGPTVMEALAALAARKGGESE